MTLCRLQPYDAGLGLPKTPRLVEVPSMNSALRYGSHAVAHFELPDSTIVAECQAPRGRPVPDVTEATAAALSEPLNFPPLASSVVPGDQVAIAIEPGVPQAEAVMAAVVRGAGRKRHRAPLHHRAHGRRQRRTGGPDAGSREARNDRRAGRAGGVRRLRHDPHDRGHLSYLANIGEGKPVYLNRAICEADFVLPIGCQRLDTSISYRGVCDSVFPTFADAGTQQRYRSPAAADSVVQRKRLRKQADEVGWLLGALFTVRVLPGPGDTVLGVLAGDVHAVDASGRQRCQLAWSFQVPRRASLVVAAIEGGPAQQTWHNVARAVSAARHAVDAGGTIAVCSELLAPPGPALQQLAAADSPEEALCAIGHERSSDALVAGELIHALENGRVYLLSRLDDEVVEPLGIAPVDNVAELARLAARHESCILLANAQYADVTPVEDGAAGDQ